MEKMGGRHPGLPTPIDPSILTSYKIVFVLPSGRTVGQPGLYRLCVVSCVSHVVDVPHGIRSVGEARDKQGMRKETI